MSDVAETTLRDALSDAFEGVESSSDLAVSVDPSITPVEAPSEPERVRDEGGRYARKEQDSPEPVQEVTQDQPAPRKAPSSWKKDYWGQFEKLDPNLQGYIEQREQEYAKGVSTYRAEAEKARVLNEAIAPFVPEMQQHGVTPEVEIRNLLSAHHTLVKADPQTKLQMFAKLATDYGVPLQALYSGQQGQPMQADPQFSNLLNEINTLRSQMGQIYQTNEQREAQAVATQIESFKASAPHFDAVRSTMAGLLQAGMAGDLQSAYEKAIRLHDDVWQQEQARQAEAARQRNQQTVAGKRAIAVSPRSTAPTGQVRQVQGNDIRSALENALNMAESGRL